MKAILIGYGEVGKGVYDYYSKFHQIDIFDLNYKDIKLTEYDLMLVTIPYSDNFIIDVTNYVNEFNPKATIIFSTVPIGTTKLIKNAVHSPVEGKHPNLGKSMELFQRFMGGINGLAIEFFVTAKQQPIILEKPEHTEFLKLQSTTNYGVMIEYARYIKSICDDINLNYESVKDFNRAYNDLYSNMGLDNIKRYILDPPEGTLGGHCVRPNAMLLDAQYPNDLVKEIYKR